MAEGTKIVLEFITSDNRTAQFSYNYSKAAPTAANVQTLMQAMITNTDIFDRTLVSIKGAKTVTTTESIIEFDDDVTNSNRVIQMNAEPTVDEGTIVKQETVQPQA